MTPRISLIGAVAATFLVVLTPAALADDWGRDRHLGPSVAGSPDLVDRVVAARQTELATMLDARERAQAAKRHAQLAAAPRQIFDRHVRGDAWRPVDSASGSPSAAPIGADDEVEWSQVGFGVGIGILFALGSMLALRAARGGQVAH